MIVRPGMPIYAGRKSNKRKGTICALVTNRNANSPVYLISAYHVLAGKHRPPRARIYLSDGTHIANYRAGTPMRWIGVDVAFAQLLPGVVYENITPSGVSIINTKKATRGNSLTMYRGVSPNVHGKVTSTGRLFPSVRTSVEIKYTGSGPIVGDSGAPWINPDTNNLESLHTGNVPSKTSTCHGVLLEDVIQHFDMELV